MRGTEQRPSRVAIALIAILLAPGCYLSHGGTEAGVEPLEHDIYLRNNCAVCDAYHFSWLRRCGERLYLVGSNQVSAVFALGPAGRLALIDCSIDDGFGPLCVAPAQCDGLDVGTVAELLEIRTMRTPRGDPRGFVPYEESDDRWLGDPPTCEALIAGAPVCS